MNHQEKIALAQEELAARGVGKMTVAPPLFLLAWKLGVAIPPPHFLGFGPLAFLMGGSFGVLWGVIMWLFVWSHQGMPVVGAGSAALAAGVLFGVALASYYRWNARRLSLPSWRDYGEKGQL